MHQAQKPVVSRSPCAFFSGKAFSPAPAAGTAGKKKAPSALVFFSVCAAALLPFLDAGRGLFHSLGIYTNNWMFNSPLHTTLLLLVENNQSARLIAAVIFTAIATGIYYSYFKNQNREEPGNCLAYLFYAPWRFPALYTGSASMVYVLDDTVSCSFSQPGLVFFIRGGIRLLLGAARLCCNRPVGGISGSTLQPVPALFLSASL